jgi:nucleoside-diphosphate-sugar epimerase
MNTSNTISQKALVTGATGFLGQHLCQQLQQQGWQVYALCRSVEKGKDLVKGIHVVIGDILSPTKFENKLPDNIDAIFHTAASTNTWFKNNVMQTETNLAGTQNMLELALRHKVHRFIHISSVVVYGIHTVLKNIVETMEKSGKGSHINYVNTKVASEEIVLNTQDLDVVVINPTHIIGPGDKHNWARLFKMIATKTLPSIPNGAGSFVDVRDVAAGIIAAYAHGQAGQNYLLGGTNMDFKQFVQAVADQMNVAPTTVQLPTFLLKLLGHVKNVLSYITGNEPDITPESVDLISDRYTCDSQKAKSELGFHNRSFDETLKQTIAYLKDNQLIN